MSKSSDNNSFLDKIQKRDSSQNIADQHGKRESSFIDRYQKKAAMTSTKLDDKIDSDSDSERKPIDPKKRALAKYIYLVKGIDANKKAWYYVLVEALKVQLFLKALNDDIIHLEHYGKILYSAYGEEPPAHVTKALKDEYGID